MYSKVSCVKVKEMDKLIKLFDTYRLMNLVVIINMVK